MSDWKVDFKRNVSRFFEMRSGRFGGNIIEMLDRIVSEYGITITVNSDDPYFQESGRLIDRIEFLRKTLIEVVGRKRPPPSQEEINTIDHIPNLMEDIIELEEKFPREKNRIFLMANEIHHFYIRGIGIKNPSQER